jgi:hypothetical protein
MAGQASGGQKLTPNRNVTAPAGAGGDKWGANGGDINPMSGSKPLAATAADGETATNYIVSPKAPLTVMSQESLGVLDKQSADSAIPAGGSNAG